MNTQKSFLIILDGWGIYPDPDVSAIKRAHTPYFNQLNLDYPHSTLTTFGMDVGLPEGQMGNSEVGHMNLGAGKVVYQELARIHKAIEDQELQNHPLLLEALHYAKENNRKVHLLGLISDGGVHSHIRHLLALCDTCILHNIPNVFIHAITDGRDTDPKGGIHYLEMVDDHIKNSEIKWGSLIGRYYAMDRDNRWERIQLAYDLLVNGAGTGTRDIFQALRQSYSEKISDEFVQPHFMMNERGKAVAKIEDGDVVVFFNFRTDRPRELTYVLTQSSVDTFPCNPLDLKFVTFARYDETFKNQIVLFEKDDIKETMGEVVSKHGLTQVRIAETEKYPHVTFFFNGGREARFEGEDRILIPSPKVATYDLQPEMSAFGITKAIMDYMVTHQPDFICLNFANADMVGHTGMMSAAVAAVEAVDKCLSEMVPLALELNYNMLIIADHGNADYMVNPDGSPNTAHSMNPVPCILVSKDAHHYTIDNGKLADIAPTLLTLMGVPIPEEMTGNVLIHSKK